MQLGKELCRFGRVLYESYEEGVRPSFRRRIGYLKMDEVQGSFRVVTNDNPDELRDLAAAPLALGYVIPAIRAHSGLAPVRQCSCRAYKKESYLRNSLFSWRSRMGLSQRLE